MKAIAAFFEKKQINIIDIEEPTLARTTDVKIKVLEVGVCGTDREIASFQYGVPVNGNDYLILGHEVVGQVTEIGNEVKDIKVGDYVYVMVRRPCTDKLCLPCRTKHQDFCTTGKYTERGISGHHGFLTEYIVDEEQYVVKIPAQLVKVGILIDAFVLIAKALQMAQKIQLRLPALSEEHELHRIASGASLRIRPRALILGAGPIGLTAMFFLLHEGYDTVIYSHNLDETKINIIEKAGAQYVCAEKSSLLDSKNSNDKFGFIYEATGSPELALESTALLLNNGVLVLTGIPATGTHVLLDGSTLMRNLVLGNQVVLGCVNADIGNCCYTVKVLEEMMTKWPELIAQLITGRYPFGEYVSLVSKPSTDIKATVVIE